MKEWPATWRDGEARDAIQGFVRRVCREGSAEFVAPSARVAVFDNDGTLWCERPGHARAFFVIDRRWAIDVRLDVGRRPILAAGNTAGDREMLEYAQTGRLPVLCLAVDDDEREYADAGSSLTDPGAEPIAETAARLGRITVSMRREWAQRFPDGADA